MISEFVQGAIAGTNLAIALGIGAIGAAVIMRLWIELRTRGNDE